MRNFGGKIEGNQEKKALSRRRNLTGTIEGNWDKLAASAENKKFHANARSVMRMNSST